ncbi:ADP/ATP translocase [Balamuthia mandrillaris]
MAQPTHPTNNNTTLDATASFLKDFTLGGVSGAVAKTMTAPIERVKLLLQTMHANPRILSGEIPPYKGIVDCFRRVAAEQGLPSFWRGNLTNVIRYFPTQAFNFAFKDSIKMLFPRYDPTAQFGQFFLVQMASGGLAGAGSLCLVYPLDYARTRLAADAGKGAKRDFNGLADCLAKTARGPRGLLGLYNGFGVSVAGIIPYRGVYFGLYDSLREKNPWKNDLGTLGMASKFGVAQTTALAAAYASYPFDTVRRRLQMGSDKAKEASLYKGAVDCFCKIVREEGVRALYHGAYANVFRTVGSALVLVFYDQLQGMLGLNLGAGSE